MMRQPESSSATVLATLRHYLPGYRLGGPVRSLANLIDRLGEEFRFKIVTSDRDVGDRAPYADVPIDAWTPLGRASVFYASPRARSPVGLWRLLQGTSYDVLYLNSFFDPVFSILPLALRRSRLIPKRPVVLAPRGEFAPSALALKARKKRLFRTAARLTGLYRGLVWQASSPLEAQVIRPFAGENASILVAGMLLGPASREIDATVRRVKPAGTLRIVLLGRIAPMKNLEGALEILRGLDEGEVTFDIYGPIEDRAYWARCEALIRTLPSNVVASHRGALAPDQVAGVLATHDLFLLPTLGENFGHVIAEALGAGLPVVISNRTPWRGLEAAGVGFDLALEDPDAFRAVLKRAIEMTPADFSAWSDRVRAFAAARFDDPETVQSNRQLFRHVVQAR